MMKFNTEEERDAANLAIGAEIQRRGRINNPNYNCEKWAEGVDIVDGYTLPDTPIAEELGIEYETADPKANDWYMVFKKKADAEAACAINGKECIPVKGNKYVIQASPLEEAKGVEGNFTVQQYDPKWFK